MKNKTNFLSVFVFYLTACIISWPFFWWRDLEPESWKQLQLPSIVKTWSYMWGPGIAAVICFVLFKNHKRVTTFKGTSWWRGLLFYSLVPISLSLWNLKAQYLLIGVLGFVSILGEELGWRGFLQDALKFRSDWTKAIVIGAMWEMWHFTNRVAGKSPGQAVKLILIWTAGCIVISYILIKLTNKTKSLMVAVTFHTVINVLFEFNYAWQAMLTCLPFWILIYISWQNQINTVEMNNTASE
jgi:uncharacterized protein